LYFLSQVEQFWALYFEPSRTGFEPLGLVSQPHRMSLFGGLQRLEEGVKQAYVGTTCEASRRHMKACLLSLFCHLSFFH